MASPLHLWLKVADGTPIPASSKVLGREGSIEVLRHYIRLSSPSMPVPGNSDLKAYGKVEVR